MVEANQLYNLIVEMNMSLKENTKILNQMNSSPNYVRPFDSPLRNLHYNQISSIENSRSEQVADFYFLLNKKIN